MSRLKGSRNAGPAVRHCHRCRCEIIGYTDEWAYRRKLRMAGTADTREHIFCTWSCLCAAQREADEYFGKKPDKYEKTCQHKLERDRRRYDRKKEKA